MELLKFVYVNSYPQLCICNKLDRLYGNFSARNVVYTITCTVLAKHVCNI